MLDWVYFEVDPVPNLILMRTHRGSTTDPDPTFYFDADLIRIRPFFFMPTRSDTNSFLIQIYISVLQFHRCFSDFFYLFAFMGQFCPSQFKLDRQRYQYEKLKKMMVLNPSQAWLQIVADPQSWSGTILAFSLPTSFFFYPCGAYSFPHLFYFFNIHLFCFSQDAFPNGPFVWLWTSQLIII